ncbi:MAG TPA: hypothetical protein PLK94_01200 [Alphaproteobacteria bacterium]|nr:hypothetical protein [Alphaproteobacteria bacterium]HOO49884.1 hypothetical protein [Alphaproteobacteria bacterium]
MLTLFGRWLKGLIAGWLMAFIFFLIKRALQRAFGDVASMQAEAQNDPTRAARHGNTSDIIETIWIGMSADQLRMTFGAPTSKEKVSFTQENWIYQKWQGRDTPTKVTLENNKVTSWEELPPLQISATNS